MVHGMALGKKYIHMSLVITPEMILSSYVPNPQNEEQNFVLSRTATIWSEPPEINNNPAMMCRTARVYLRVDTKSNHK